MVVRNSIGNGSSYAILWYNNRQEIDSALIYGTKVNYRTIMRMQIREVFNSCVCVTNKPDALSISNRGLSTQSRTESTRESPRKNRFIGIIRASGQMLIKIYFSLLRRFAKCRSLSMSVKL